MWVFIFYDKLCQENTVVNKKVTVITYKYQVLSTIR